MRFWKEGKQVLRTAMAALAFMAMLPYTALAAKTDTFVSGTKVNGLSISGMTVEEAKSYLTDFYAGSYRLTIYGKEEEKEILEGTEVGYRVTFAEEFQSILEAQNAGGREAGPQVDNSHQIAMTVSFDAAALDTRIQALHCISGEDRIKTADAHISEYREGEPFTVIPEVEGNDVDPVKTAEVIHRAVSNGDSQISLEDEGCYVTVQADSQNETLIDLCTVMNQCREMEITYAIGEATEVLPGSRICSWLTGSSDGVIQVDQGSARAYIFELKDKYDTAGKARTFQTAAGSEVVVGGSYGWSIDENGETDALIAMIRTGQTQTREPQYSLTAVPGRNRDWGTTYIEIDLTGQHVYLTKDGEIVWDAPCVTGNVSKNNATPTGIYSIAYKETDRILRGKKLENNTYEYESHVDYWMPFNGGIGLHDASWRSKFGGTIYKTNGSHGCINLPPEKVPELYALVYKGMPVICYN